LGALLPLRAELSGGDLRALYLAWLAGAQTDALDDDDQEPTCPPGLGKLSGARGAFADFLRIDRDLIDAAAAASPALLAIDDVALQRWVSALPEDEKTSLLVRLVGGGRGSRRGRAAPALPRRTCRSAAGSQQEVPYGRRTPQGGGSARGERCRQEAERAAREKARREREAAEARERHLAALAQREAQAWRELDQLIATKQPKRYDEAVGLLRDLGDVCTRSGRDPEAAKRIARLHEEHARKSGLIERLRKAGLLAVTTE
jgi:hypothetical protein